MSHSAFLHDAEPSTLDIHPARPPMQVREGLDFHLDETVPRHWFGGDPFKTRFFDALSTLFPEGERFFIACVRDYRGEITDPAMRQAVQDFTRQEGQHTRVHNEFNALLARQGIKVDKILANQRHLMFDVLRTHLSREQTLALTAALEHITAIMAFCLFERVDQFKAADRRVLALYRWHAIEEVEHKAVTFDVMQKVARVGYWRRTAAMVQVSLDFPRQLFGVLDHMLKVDGYGRRERMKIWAKGLWWLYGPGGLLGPLLRPWLAWFRPGFHPWDIGQQPSYPLWADALAMTGDPVAASEAVDVVDRRLQHA